MLLFILFVIFVATVAIVVASALDARGRKLSPGEKALAWTAMALAVELFYLFALGVVGASTAALVFGAVLPVVTLGFGALTIWVLKN